MDGAARRAEIAALGLLDRRPPEAITHLLHAARLLTGASDAQLNVLTDEAQVTLVNADGRSLTTPLPDSMCARVLATEHGDVQVPDATQDVRYSDVGLVVSGDLVGYAASPLVTSAGVTIGTVCVFSEGRLDIAPHLVEALHEVARSCMLALEARRNARSVSEVLNATRGRFQLLDRTNEHLSAFAGQVAHDLQGPLSTITFALQWLRDDLVEGEAPELLRTALAGSERLQRTVASLLEFAQLGGRPELVPVRVADLVTDVLQDLEVARDRVAVEVGELPVVDAVPVLLRALLLNLVDNAFKYAGDGENPVVRISGTTDAEAWRIQVEDNGPGVSATQRERIFEPMTRGIGEGVLARVGQGIGLATCRRVAQVHGGRIGVEESPLGGACFWLEVPVGPTAT
ncbi:sensor histidine kinase [Nocardioides marmoraquaticus]